MIKINKNNIKIIAIIPAKKNSTRLQNKNMKLFLGKPLIYYTIKFAIKANFFDQIYVSSDDQKILNYSSKYGVKTILRPKKYSDNYASTYDVLKHSLKKINPHLSETDLIVTLQVTSPLRSLNLIEQTKKIIKFKKNFDSIVSVSKFSSKVSMVKDGLLKPLNYNFGQRSQDLSNYFYENGQFYLSKIKTLENQNNMFGEKVCYIKSLSKLPSIDIDEKLDFIIGEFLFNEYLDEFKFLK